MNFKEYIARPEISASGLKNFMVSPAYFKWKKEHPEETEAMRIGKALHCAILTPELFKEEYAQIPICDKRTKEGKAIYEVFLNGSEGKECLKFEEYEKIIAIRNAVLKSPKIVSMLSKGQSEFTIFSEIEGVKVKSRLDFLAENFFLDIKSTKDARLEQFSIDAYNLDYHCQFWIYQEAIFQNFGKRLPCIIFAIEKEDNLDYMVHEMSQEWLDLGEKKVRKYLRLYKECLEKDEWPGYDKKINQLVLPSWVKVEE